MSIEHVCEPVRRPVRVDGIDYSHQGIMALRRDLINIRDAALLSGQFTTTVVLTHCVAMLAYLLEWQDWEGVE